MIDAHSAESNEKSILRFFWFLFFELWLIVFTIYRWHTGIFKCVTNPKKKSFKSGWIQKKDAQWVETIETSIFRFMQFLIFWVMLDFVLKIQRKIDQFWLQKRPYLKNYKSENYFYICFSIFHIFHAYMTTFKIWSKNILSIWLKEW